MSEKLPRIGISIGDPNGIGPEVLLKAYADERFMDSHIPVVYSPPKVIAYYKQSLGLDKIRYKVVGQVSEAMPQQLNVIAVSDQLVEDFVVTPGLMDVTAGEIAVDAILRAAQDLDSGLLDGIVTNPINKYSTHSQKFPYAGHTDFFSSRFALLKGKAVMLLTAVDSCTVAPVTVHLPLKEVAVSLSKDIIIEKAMMLDLTLKRDFNKTSPVIGVLALNPHAGDNGLLGHEEEEIIGPAVQELFEQHKIFAFGPFSPDAYWGARTYKDFDATLCMYHDQGLIPFKLLCMERGVNYTAGLRIVRCSPDHGTAYDIAGKGIASEFSFREAIYLCLNIGRYRKRFDEALKNPLKKSFFDRSRDTGIEDLPEIDTQD